MYIKQKGKIRIYDPSKSEMDIFIQKEKQRQSSLKVRAYSMEDLVKNEILLDDWWNITTNSSIYGETEGISLKFYITFDENGIIDTIIMDSFS